MARTAEEIIEDITQLGAGDGSFTEKRNGEHEIRFQRLMFYPDELPKVIVLLQELQEAVND